MHSVTGRTTGRDLAAERVRADLPMRVIATAMGVSRSRVFVLEHSDHVTAQMTARYLDALRVAVRPENKKETAADSIGNGPVETTDVIVTGDPVRQG
jgi:hypothetical protein